MHHQPGYYQLTPDSRVNNVYMMTPSYSPSLANSSERAASLLEHKVIYINIYVTNISEQLFSQGIWLRMKCCLIWKSKIIQLYFRGSTTHFLKKTEVNFVLFLIGEKHKRGTSWQNLFHLSFVYYEYIRNSPKHQ